MLERQKRGEGVSFVVKAHGESAKFGQSVVVENPRPTELSQATPAPAPAGPQRLPNGHFAKGNTMAKGNGLRLGEGGIMEHMVPDAYLLFLKWARRYAKARRRELMASHGGRISIGVASLIEAASQVKADSRYIRSTAMRQKDDKERAEMLKRAAALDNESRQHELAAWELAAREAKVRPQKSAHQSLLDALTVDMPANTDQTPKP